MKVERQGDEMYSTDLGPVSFGPVDVKDTETGPMNPNELADLLELTIETCDELEMIDDDERNAMLDLIVNLRQLPEDLPPPGEGGIPMSEHPMVQLMWESSPSFLRLWPMLQMMLHPNLAQPGAVDWNEDDDDKNPPPPRAPSSSHHDDDEDWSYFHLLPLRLWNYDLCF